MARKFTLSLSVENRLRLQRIMDRGTNWKERVRAETLILLDGALSMREVADAVGVNVRTVGSTRLAWLKFGVDGLADLPRSGAPKKISQQQVENLLILADAEPMSARQLLAKHVEDGGAPVHLNTMTGALKAAGLVWKRTRHSLKKKRDEAAFRVAQGEISLLRAQAAAGEIILGYADEAGFAQAHPNRNAWTQKGECHLIEAKRGKRLNVLAAMMSNGDLLSAKYWQTTTADMFAGFLGLLHEYIERYAGTPITIIVDNASIHKAKSTQAVMELLKSKGVNLYFLPPYSPELNRIERLWHKMKYTWLAPKCRDPKTLEADVEEILANFGDGYKFAF